MTPAGEAWRCLRCGDFVIGAARRSGPAADAPEVPRGKLLRDRTIMRLLAAERVIRGIVLLFVAYLLVRFRGSEAELKEAFTTDLALLHPLADQIGWNLENSRIVRGISRVFDLSPTAIAWITVGVVAYASLQLVESYGLWNMKRWGEYLTVVATSVFLPWEIYEVTEKITVLRVGALIINVAGSADHQRRRGHLVAVVQATVRSARWRRGLPRRTSRRELADRGARRPGPSRDGRTRSAFWQGDGRAGRQIGRQRELGVRDSPTQVDGAPPTGCAAGRSVDSGSSVSGTAPLR